MIVGLTGTIRELTPYMVVLDVHGVAYELGISSTCAASLPPLGTPDVYVPARMIVREDDMSLYGFVSVEERALFDRLRAISGVGPKMALSILSTFTVADLARVVMLGDVDALTSISGVGKKTAQRLMVELTSIFEKDALLKNASQSAQDTGVAMPVMQAEHSIEKDVTDALLSMGFTTSEASLALQGLDQLESVTLDKAVAYALKRLGGLK